MPFYKSICLFVFLSQSAFSFEKSQQSGNNTSKQKPTIQSNTTSEITLTLLNQPHSIEEKRNKLHDNYKLMEFLKSKQNYSKLERTVKKWYRPNKSNGCVAYLSTALRMIGVRVPFKQIKGSNISLVTHVFSDYLEKKLNWMKISEHNELKPGDIVFTKHNKAGRPAHTYVFVRWSDKQKGIAHVVDNQGHNHKRNIYKSGTYNFTPFKYALRHTPKLPTHGQTSKKASQFPIML